MSRCARIELDFGQDYVGGSQAAHDAGSRNAREGEDFMISARLRSVPAAWAVAVVAGACLLWTVVARAVDPPDLFEGTSPDFPDNGMLSEDNASTGTNLRGP